MIAFIILFGDGSMNLLDFDVNKQRESLFNSMINFGKIPKINKARYYICR